MNRLARLFWIVLATLLVVFANVLTATASPSPGHGSAVFFKGPVSSIGNETDERPVASSPLCICHVYDADRLYGPTHFAWSEAAQRPASEGGRRWMFLDGPARADRLRYDGTHLLREAHFGMATKPAAGAADDVVRTCFRSFGGETKVLMADGTTKAISEVEVGDVVLAQDPVTGERGPRTVSRLWVHDDDLVRLEIAGDIVRTTEDHPFWNDTDKQWQRADQLGSGEFVLTADGRRVRVGVLMGSAGRGLAYNLTVEGLHTYHVFFGTDAVLVHNVCGDDLVSDILKGKKGSIRQAPLPEGAPAWDDVLGMSYAEIEAAAKANTPGFKTIKKLLTDKRFNK